MLKSLYASAVWKSIFRHGLPNTERNRALLMMSNVFLHLHPVKVRRQAVRFTATLGLGGLSLYLFLITGITGLFLMVYYIPSPALAYASMKDLEFAVFLGTLMRNMHRWAAHGMVAVVFLHMCRVFYTGSYKAPREFNWVIGIVLLILTCALSYSGYLLPWDQLAYWGVTVGTNIMGSIPVIGKKIRYVVLGGTITDQNALIRFYVLHCFFLPAVAATFMAIHFWRIRKDGGIAGPCREEPQQDQPVAALSDDGTVAGSPVKTYGLMALARGTTPLVQQQPEDTVDTWPHLVYRELIMAVAATAALLGLSYAFMAPLEELANPEFPPHPAKAPWYFLGIQELVSWMSPFIAGVLIPGLMVFALVLLPYVDRDPRGVGVWVHPARKSVIAIFTLWVMFMGILILIGEYCRGPGWVWYWPWELWP